MSYARKRVWHKYAHRKEGKRSSQRRPLESSPENWEGGERNIGTAV